MRLTKPPFTQKNTLKTALITSLLATTASVHANQAETKANKDIEHLVVTGERANKLKLTDKTATKMDVALKDVGRSVTVLDSTDLDMRAIEDIRDAFNYVAGFRNNGAADRTYTARGLRTSIDNVMIDGLRSMQGGEGGTGSRLPSTFNAEATTFLRGPEALLYGAGIAGGIVNITTKKPQESAQTTFGFNNKSYVSGDTGNFKRNDFNLSVDSTGPLGDKNLLYRALAQYTPSGEHYQKGRELEETLLDFSFTSTHLKNTEITARFEYADRFKTGGSSYADGVFDENFFKGEVVEYGKPVNRGYYYGSEKDKGENTAKSINLEVAHFINDNWDISAKYRHNSTESESLDLYISDSSGLGNTLGNDTVNRKWVYALGDDNYQLFDLATEGKFTLGGLEHHLLAGINYRDMDVKFARTFQANDDAVGKNTISASKPWLQTIGALPTGFTQVEPSPSSQKDTNIYIKDRISFSSGTTLVAGLAYVKQKQNQTRGDNTFSKTFSDTIWDLGLVQQINDDINVFATYSRAYAPINARWIAQYGQGKTDYVPVEGNNYEIGIKADMLDGDLATAVTLFTLNRENSTSWQRGANGWQLTQLSGKSFESKGLEIDTTYFFNEQFDSTLSYAYTRANDTIGDNIGKQANNTPKHSAALWNTYQHNKNWSFSLGFKYESKRNDGKYILPNYLEVDAGAYYQLANWKVSLVATNLLDKNRAESGANWAMVLPNEPRALNLSVKYTL